MNSGLAIGAGLATIAGGVVAVLSLFLPSAGSSSSAPAPSPPAVSAAPSPASSPPAAAAQPVPRAVKLSSPDLDGYCRGTGQGRAQLSTGDHRWRCSGTGHPLVNLDAACRQTNHDGTAHASTANFYTGAIDCWSVTHPYGAPRFDAYCRQQGYPGAQNTDSTVYGWQCARAPQPIYVSSVCQWQLGSQQTTAIFTDFTDENSWTCWG